MANKFDKDSVNQRLNSIVDAFETGVKSAFASKIGISVQGVHDLLSGRKGYPSFKVLSSILDSYPMLNANWLVMGQGPMLQNEVSSNATDPAFLKLAKLAGQFLRLGMEFSAKQAAYEQSSRMFETMQRHEAESKAHLEEEKASATPDGQYLQILEQRVHAAQANRAAYSSVYLQDEAAFVDVARRRAELEKELTELIGSAVPLTAEAQMEAIKSRLEISQAFEAAVKPK